MEKDINLSAIDVRKYDECSMFDENLIKVRVNNLEGLIDINGNIIIEPIYKHVKKYTDDLIKIEKDKKMDLLLLMVKF